MTGKLPAGMSVLDYVSPSAALVARRPPRIAGAVIWIVVTLFAASLGVSALFSIERVVESRGRITTPGSTITVQPLESAIIRSVDVRLNQVVRAGQVLAHLDPTFSSADVGTLESRAAALRSEIARLEAELGDHPFVGGQDPNSVLQTTIHAQRQAEFQARMENFRQRLDAQQATRERATDGARRLRERLAVAVQVESMRRELEQGQIGSKLNLLNAIDGRLEVARALATTEAEERTAAREIEALRAEGGAYAAQWHAQVSQQLSERRTTMAEVQENLAKARLRNRLVELTAPADAIVLELGKSASGAVLQPGETMMTLVPLDSQLEIESEVDARDIGFVAVGDRVDIKLDAFPYVRHGTVRGSVRTMSGDAFTRGMDGQQRSAYYRVRIALESFADLRALPADFHLVPGSPVVADIVVGRRTVLAYFFEKIMQPAREGLREP